MNKDILEKCDALIEKLNILKKADRPSPVVNKQDLVKKAQEITEKMQAQRLANMLTGKNVFGTDMVPRQPTDQEMFGHLVVTEEMAKAKDKEWGSTMNWLQEAVKPINARFKNAEEERAYWDSLNIPDRDDKQSGF